MKILKIFLIILVSARGFLFFPNTIIAEEAPADTPAIIINEIFWTGSSLSLADEFIELYNTTEEDLDISEWIISGAATNQNQLILPASSTIPALGFFIIANYPPDNEKSIINIEADHVSSSISLANSDASYVLKNSKGESVDYADDGFDEPLAGDNELKASMARKPGCWDGGLEECWFTSEIRKNLKEEIEDFATPGADNGWEEPIINNPPTAIINAPATAEVNLEVLLNAFNSFDADEDELEYAWMIGEDLISTKEQTVAVFNQAATYEISLEVNDGELSGATTTQIVVYPKAIEPYQPQVNDILINEFVSNPEEGEEWIEIYNASTSTIDLSGWEIWDGRGKIFSLEEEIASQEYRVAHLPSAKLNNSGDQIILKFGEVIINHVTYGDWEDNDVSDNAPAPGQPHALARTPGAQNTNSDNDKYQITVTPTPGETNIITPVPDPEPEKEPKEPENEPNGQPEEPNEPDTNPEPQEKTKEEDDENQTVQTLPKTFPSYNPGDLIINEFVSNPEEGEEWIEIFNPGQEKIDLNGWKVTDEKDTPTNLKEFIAPQSFMVIYSPKGQLNNGGDSISLFDPNNNLINQISYGNDLPAPPKGNSLTRDESGQWHVSGEPTPGAANQIPESEPKTDDNESEEDTKTTKIKKNDASDKKTDSKNKNNYVSTNFTEASSWQEKQKIIVNGIVTAPPGLLGTQYFYLGDNQGRGLQIYNYKKDFPKLDYGQVVSVKGELSKTNDMWRLKTKSAEDILNQEFEEPNPLEIGTDQADLEYLAGFVSLSGEVTEFKSSYLYLDDGSGELKITFNKSNALENIKLIPGDQIKASGILTATKSGLRLETRLSDDIEIITQNKIIDNPKENESRGYSNWAGLIPLGILVVIGLANMKKLKKIIPKK